MNEFNTIDDLMANFPRGTVQLVPLEELQDNPYQPRRSYDDDTLEMLAQSLIEDGQLQPILVRPLKSGGYGIIAGHRRVRAARRARLTALQAVVRITSENELSMLSLVENLQRQNLSPLDEIEAIIKLIAFKLEIPEDAVGPLLYAVRRQQMKHESYEAVSAIFRRLGRGLHNFCTHQLPMVKFPPEIQELVQKGILKPAHAKQLVDIKDLAMRVTLIHGLEEGRFKPSEIAQNESELGGLLREMTRRREQGGSNILPIPIPDQKIPKAGKEWLQKSKKLRLILRKLLDTVRADPTTPADIEVMLEELLERLSK